MNNPIPFGVIGAGRHAQALTDHAAPLGRFVLGRPEADWRAVLVLGDPAQRAARVIESLRAERVVICPPPLAMTATELDRIAAARGKLLICGELAHTEAGLRAVQLIRAAEFGPLRSLYLSIRQQRRQSDADVLDELGWEALDFVLAVAGSGVRHVHATSATLFGSARAPDSAVILLRTQQDAVVTIELSRCLPATLPAPGLGEIEIEAIGAHQSVLIEPHATAVRIYGDQAVAAAPWLDAPVIAMLRQAAALIDGAKPEFDPLQRQRQALATMTAIRASIGAAQAVPV